MIGQCFAGHSEAFLFYLIECPPVNLPSCKERDEIVEVLIVLPIALVFSESSMNNIQSVSIISAFPIGIIMIIMIWSFIKDAKKYMVEKGITKE